MGVNRIEAQLRLVNFFLILAWRGAEQVRTTRMAEFRLPTQIAKRTFRPD